MVLGQNSDSCSRRVIALVVQSLAVKCIKGSKLYWHVMSTLLYPLPTRLPTSTLVMCLRLNWFGLHAFPLQNVKCNAVGTGLSEILPGLGLHFCCGGQMARDSLNHELEFAFLMPEVVYT